MEHYLNHGRCFSFTLRTWGYAGRGDTTVWVRALYPETRKYVVNRAEGLLSPRVSKQAVAQKLDVNRTTLYNWKEKSTTWP